VGAGFSRPFQFQLGSDIAIAGIMTDYPEHLPGFSYVGCHRYFLTFCTHERRTLFECAETVDATWAHFLRTAIEEDIEIVAYCFMHDHVHMVVEGKSESADLKRFICRAKQRSGYAYGKAHEGERLWQRYGYKHVLRDEESTERVVAYVLENPVRKGWVVHPREYPHIGSQLYGLNELLEFAYGRRAG